MSTNWKAGDKAVCVYDSPHYWTGEKLLVKGVIYLVRNTAMGILPNRIEGLGLDVGVVDSSGNPFSASFRFRKVVTRTEREAMSIEREANQ